MMKHIIEIGLGFLAGSFLLLWYGLESYFRWKMLVLGNTLFFLAILFFIFSCVLMVIGLINAKGEITPRQRERDKRLRTHFEDMQKMAPNLIPDLKENNAWIYCPNSSLSCLSNFPADFKAHFPEEDNTWKNYCANIKKHDDNYTKFLQKIKESFISAGLKWIEAQPESPGIYWRISEPLFIWWGARYNHSENITVDFERVGSAIITQGNIITDTTKLYVFGFSPAYIAYFGNEDDKKRCQKAIANVAFNLGYEKEAAELIKSAKGLVKSVNDLETGFTKKIENTDKYWGAKEYKFECLNHCQTCRSLK
jgi:hypothetical protein